MPNKYGLGGGRKELPVLAHQRTSAGHLVKGEGEAHPPFLCCASVRPLWSCSRECLPSSQKVTAVCLFISGGSMSTWEHISGLDISYILFTRANKGL